MGDNNVAFPAQLYDQGFPQQTTLPPFTFFWFDGGMKPFAPAELGARWKRHRLTKVDASGKLKENIGWIQREEGIPGDTRFLKVPIWSIREKSERIIPAGSRSKYCEFGARGDLGGKATPGSFIERRTIYRHDYILEAVAFTGQNLKLISTGSLNGRFFTNNEKQMPFLTRQLSLGMGDLIKGCPSVGWPVWRTNW